MLRFLRLFPAFRQLEHELNQTRAKARDFEQLFVRESEERKKASTERDFWQQQCLEAQKDAKELREEMVQQAQKVADTMSVHAIGKRVFSKAEPVPIPQRQPNEQRTGRQFARGIQAEQTIRTRKEFEALMRDISAS